MPKIVIEQSLYEPLEIVLGDKEFKSVPRSAAFIREMQKYQKRIKEAPADESAFVLAEFLALFFGVKPEDFTGMDIVFLERIAAEANAYIWNRPKAEAPAGDEAKAPAEAEPPAVVAPETPGDQKN